jgi:hypothetical protein
MKNAGRVVVVLIAGLLSLGAFAGVASAASETTNCAGLQAALDQATDGDTITLNEMCVGDDFALNNSADDSRSYTLTGQPGSGAGFDGTGGTTSVLHANQATPGDATSSMTVSNLIFKNSSSPGNGGAVVFQGDYSVDLSDDTFTNNQTPNGGSGGAADIETSASSASITLSNDTFTGNQAEASGAGGALNLLTAGNSATVNISRDKFTNNQTADGSQGGAVEYVEASSSGSLTIANSTFSGNTTQSEGGAIDVFYVGANPIPVNMSGNTFANNTVDGCTASCPIGGGAMAFVNFQPDTNVAVTQGGNTFSGNRVINGTQDAAGGAEWLQDMDVSSTGDVFAGNLIQAPASGHLSQGSGIAAQNICGAGTLHFVASNLVVAGNSIGDGGTAVDAQGAVAVPCLGGGGGPGSNLVTLNNATISGNTGGGGTAGLSGDPLTNASLQNSILTANSDGTNLGGFASPATVTATYTDLCNGASPFTGTGNICADPALANASAGDAHETSSSPTIDVGSNALVPNGLTTDVYGVSRIQPKIFGGTPVVDMGAAEFPSIPLPPTASIATPSNGATYALGQAVKASYTCTEGGGGPGISSCAGPVANGSPIDTSSTGTHTFKVTATSSDGQTGTASVSYAVAAAPSVTIAAPVSGARYIRGHSTVLASFSCHEGASGPGLSSCTGTVPNGRRINTTAPGQHTFRVTAGSSDGQVTTATVRYRVVFPSNKPVKPPHLKPHSDGRFIVTVKVPHRGRVDILVTAWKDNFTPGFHPAADIGPPKPVLLQPAAGRFVFARAHKTFGSGGTYQILVTPNAAGRRLVMHHRYRVTLRLWISYTPWGGHPGKLGYYGLHLP